LSLVREILESAGARVRTAASTLDALESIASEPPDVLVSDLGMLAVDPDSTSFGSFDGSDRSSHSHH